METRQVITAEDAKRLADTIVGLPLPFTLTWREGEIRSIPKNNTVHDWFGELAQQMHCAMWEIKGECNLVYGVPRRLKDPMFSWTWQTLLTVPAFTREKQVAYLGKGCPLGVTSRLTDKEMGDYMNEMARDYRQQGYTLREPEK